MVGLRTYSDLNNYEAVEKYERCNSLSILMNPVSGSELRNNLRVDGSVIANFCCFRNKLWNNVFKPSKIISARQNNY